MPLQLHLTHPPHTSPKHRALSLHHGSLRRRRRASRGHTGHARLRDESVQRRQHVCMDRIHLRLGSGLRRRRQAQRRRHRARGVGCGDCRDGQGGREADLVCHPPLVLRLLRVLGLRSKRRLLRAARDWACCQLKSQRGTGGMRGLGLECRLRCGVVRGLRGLRYRH